MGRKLYVGNLSFNINEDSLINLFSGFGAVDTAKIVQDRETGRSRGFAFVEMSTDAEAQAAIDGLNGKDQDGRALNVSEAKPMAPRENNRGFGNNRRY